METCENHRNHRTSRTTVENYRKPLDFQSKTIVSGHRLGTAKKHRKSRRDQRTTKRSNWGHEKPDPPYENVWKSKKTIESQRKSNDFQPKTIVLRNRRGTTEKLQEKQTGPKKQRKGANGDMKSQTHHMRMYINHGKSLKINENL